MLCVRLLAYFAGTMNQELLLRNEYLAAENRILRGQIKGRLLLSEGEKATLAEIAHRLARMVVEDVAAKLASYRAVPTENSVRIQSASLWHANRRSRRCTFLVGTHIGV
jgi:hypothetical protein